MRSDKRIITMVPLSIYLFGGCKIIHPGYPVPAKITKRIKGLLAFLVINSHRTHPRDILTTVFWGDQREEQARNCLSTALWRLRGFMEPSGVVTKGTYLLNTSDGEIGFNRESDHWLDVAIFEKQVARILSKPIQRLKPEDVSDLTKALTLYTGDLLEGFYDDWAIRERERMRDIHLKTLISLLGYWRDTGAYDEGLACGQRILELDPLREEIHREVMRLYMTKGQRAMAIRQYQACCSILKEELDVLPMEETQALYTRIIRTANQVHGGNATGSHANLSGSGSSDRSSFIQAVNNLHQIIEDSENLTRRLRQIAKSFMNVTKS
jgi:DNA-binding SARP family transcriptional activator